MDDSEIPKRSSFWFDSKQGEVKEIKIFDPITIFFLLVLSFFTFTFYWPIIAGISFEEAFFTPLAPALISFLGYLGTGADQALRILFISSLVVSTCGLYLLVRELTRRQVVPILSALIYLLPPVPIFILTFVRQGFLEQLVSAKSFMTIVYGDGAHFLALALIPLAVLFYIKFLKTQARMYFALVVLALVLVLLANRSQSLFLFLILAIVTVTEMFLSSPAAKLKSMVLVFVLSLGLVSFWYIPSFWVSGASGLLEYVSANFKYFFPLPAAVLLLSLAFAFVFFARRPERQPIFAAFLIFIVLLAVNLSFLVNGTTPLPHPQRLLPDILMFGSIVAALALGAVFDKSNLESIFKFDAWPFPAKVVGTFGFAVFAFVPLSIFAYLVSPIAVNLVAGPSGIWTRVRLDVLADRSKTLAAAGGPFQLTPLAAPSWELILGSLISVVFLANFLYLFFVKFKAKS